MRKPIVISFVIVLMILLSLIVVNANDILTVEANVLNNLPILSVNVPDHVFIGNVSKGKETDKVRIDINNTGNVPIRVTPELVGSDDIFENLYFARRTTDSYKKIGSWNMNISAPVSDYESDYFYMKLDLRSYEGNITQDYIGRQANVKFVVALQ